MNWNKYLAEVLKWDTIRIDPKGFMQLTYVTPVKPREYLAFSDKDLLLNSEHGYVNALSNAKRAIDCQITNMLSVLGLNKSGNIHSKMSRIEEIGILAPRILKKVNKIRNLLEHQFHKPTSDEAEDAVDIATLFIESTEKVFVNFMDSFWLAREGSENRLEMFKEGNKTIIIDDALPLFTFADGMYIDYSEENNDFGVSCYLSNKEVLEVEIEKGSPLHIELLKICILNHNNVLDYDDNIVASGLVQQLSTKDGVSL